MGVLNSRDTRVIPFFDQFVEWDNNGNPIYDKITGYKYNAKLQSLVDYIAPEEKVIIGEETKLFFGVKEKTLPPPKELIKHLIENPVNTDAEIRLDKYNKENKIKTYDIIKNIDKYFAKKRKGYIFEGYTHPDIYIETNSHIIVIEAKRTEKISISTKWLKNRDQMIRHIEGALQEADGNKKVLAYFIVENKPNTISNYSDFDYYKKSMPHYTNDGKKIQEVMNCCKNIFLWQDLFRIFNNISISKTDKTFTPAISNLLQKYSSTKN